MHRSRMFILAAVALVLSIAVTAVAYKALKNRLEPSDDMSQIVVAAHDVALGTRLTEADLRLAPWPRAVPLKGSFLVMAEIVGRGVVVPMISNEPVLDSKLAPSGGGSGLATAIPDGMRAVSVKVDDVVGVAGFVLPGSRVDVILSGSPDNDREVQISKVILENIQVLAAGQNVTREGDGKPQDVQVVTLLVTPDDSQKLALGSVEGKIQLSLRNPLDLSSSSPVAVHSANLYGNPVAPPAQVAQVKKPVARPAVKPAPPAPPLPTPVAAVQSPKVELIQGKNSETVTFAAKP